MEISTKRNKFKLVMLGFLFAWPFALRHSLFAAPEWGVLVLAHGGNKKWNAQVEKAVEKAELPYPVETVFGMAVMPQEVEGIYQALMRLREKGVEKVVAVAFLVSSHSSVYRQYEYVLGLRKEPGFSEEAMHAMATMGSASHAMPMAAVVPRPSPFPVVLTRALDGSPELAEVLSDRIAALRRRPGKEDVVLVAHGPNGDQDDELWKKTLMEEVVEQIKKREGRTEMAEFVAGDNWVVTLREDAPPEVRARGTRHLELVMEEMIRKGKTALVVPVLISSGGIEKGIEKRLKGKGYRYRMGKPLLPHPALSAWISRRVRETVEAEGRGGGNERSAPR
jgi:sirohydrochlorin ferrochelatase